MRISDWSSDVCSSDLREHVYEIYEEVCGARLTTNIGRIGGFERDFNDIAFAKIRKFLREFPPILKQFETLFNRNRIFRSEERRVGKECVRTGRSRWSRYN